MPAEFRNIWRQEKRRETHPPGQALGGALQGLTVSVLPFIIIHILDEALVSDKLLKLLESSWVVE